MKVLLKTIIVFLLITLAVRSTKATSGQESNGDNLLVAQSHFPYKNSSQGCNFVNEPCAPLNDCWGVSPHDQEYSIVGLSNGVSILNTTDVNNVSQIPGGFFPGCLTEWRDIKSYHDTLYVVTDKTTMCTCVDPPCQFQLRVNTQMINASVVGVGTQIKGSDIHITGPLLSMPAGSSDDGCPPEDAGPPKERLLDGGIAFVYRGNCSIASKLLYVQQMGAKAAVIVSYRDDVIYPSMGGNSTGIEIPGILVSKTDGQILASQLAEGKTPQVDINAQFYVNNPLYGPPEGLWVIDFSNPSAPTMVQSTREFFDFSHNVLIDPVRAFAYFCGMDTYNGGLLVLDISDPLHPKFAGSYNQTYFHDIEVEYRDDLKKYVLYGSAIYDAQVLMLDVTDPSKLATDPLGVELARWDTLAWPHNTASTPDGRFLYLTHEALYMPVTVWEISSLTDIKHVANISYRSEEGSIPHNAFIRDNLLWLSYYNSGVAVFDIKNPANPELIAVNNTMTHPDFRLPVQGFHGVWGIFVNSQHQDRSIAYASDIETGFWIMELVQGVTIDDSEKNNFTMGVLVAVSVLVICVVVFAILVYWKKRSRQVDHVNVPGSPFTSVGLLNEDDDDDLTRVQDLSSDDDDDDDTAF